MWNRKSLRNWETETSRVDGRRIKIRSTLIEIAPSFRLYIYIKTILLKIIRNDRSKLHSKGSFVEKETNYVKSFIPLFRIAILLHLFWPSVFFILNSYHARLLKKTSRDKGYGWWKATNWAAEREIKIARVLQRRSHKFKYEQKEGFSLFFFLFFFYPPPFFLLIVDHSKRDHNRNVAQKNDGWNKEIHREKLGRKRFKNEDRRREIIFAMWRGNLIVRKGTSALVTLFDSEILFGFVVLPG